MFDLKRYVDILHEEDRTYVNESRRYDPKAEAFYEQGISVELEEPSKEKIFNKLLGVSNVRYEVPYEEHSSDWKGRKGPKTRMDIEVNIQNAVTEYKKVHKVYNNGGMDEHTNKKLFNTNAALSPYNPFTKKLEYSSSVIGDIEKLLTLPSHLNRYMVLEYWTNKEHYPADIDLELLDHIVNKYYNVEKDSIEYTDSIHPVHTICHIVVYKILGKK